MSCVVLYNVFALVYTKPNRLVNIIENLFSDGIVSQYSLSNSRLHDLI